MTGRVAKNELFIYKVNGRKRINFTKELIFMTKSRWKNMTSVNEGNFNIHNFDIRTRVVHFLFEKKIMN